MNVGDGINYVMGMPGPDVTQLVVVAIEDDGTMICRDPGFDIDHIPVKPESRSAGPRIGSWWPMQPRDFKMRVHHHKYGSITVEELLKK